MTTLYQLKPAFQDGLRPGVQFLADRGATANQVTLAALALALAAGAALASSPGAPAPLLALPVVQLVRMGLNAVDGMLAREHGQRTPLGGLLNELCDVTSDAALTLPLALVPGVSAPLIVAIVWLALISEFTGVLGLAVGGVRQYQGPMGKSDRAFVFGALALSLGMGVAPGPGSTLTLGLVLVLLVRTISNRAQAALGAAAGSRA